MTEAYDRSESCNPPFAFSQSGAIAVSMSWLLLKTSNIFFSGSYGKISLRVSNPELLHAVAVHEPEDELPRREVSISLVVKGSERLVAI